MAASDDFKTELRKDELSVNSIRNALQTALSEAIELKITTWVVPVDDSGAAPEAPRPGNRMFTRINIVDGDIDNEVGSQFIGNGPYAELRQFHLGQVQESREILQQNLENLQQLFSVLIGTLQRLPQATVRDQPKRPSLPGS